MLQTIITFYIYQICVIYYDHSQAIHHRTPKAFACEFFIWKHTAAGLLRLRVRFIQNSVW